MLYFSPFLEIQIKELSSSSNLNLTKYRLIYSRPIVNHDLISFAGYVDVVASQLPTASSAINFRNVAYETKLIIENELKVLEELRERILYKITSLELILKPVHLVSDEVQGQMAAILSIVDYKGDEIAKKVILKKFYY